MKKIFEDYLSQWKLKAGPGEPKAVHRLFESMNYSLDSGGKRFRPQLAMLTAKTLNHDVERVLPIAVAVEMIHTYSLIHDDLPVMDNDDTRRGRPTNHKVFGEGLALLAGDALLTEAFFVLTTAYEDEPEVAGKTVALLSTAAGARGMVGGQAVDIQEDVEEKKQWISLIHRKKTGALIATSIEASAVACHSTEKQQKALTEFGEKLGFAFQLSDDLLDWNPESPEPTSYVSVYGLEQTQSQLQFNSQECLRILSEAQLPTEFFAPLVDFNQSRKI